MYSFSVLPFSECTVCLKTQRVSPACLHCLHKGAATITEVTSAGEGKS
jgi:hypothetical protein